MKKSVADFVASNMDSILKSDAHQSLFNGYKVAQANPPVPSATPKTPPGNAPGAATGAKPAQAPGADTSKADDKCEAEDCLQVHDHDMKVDASLTTAIDSLLTASAALDKAGDSFAKIAEATLSFAAKLVEAKKAPAKAKKDGKAKNTKKEEKPKSKKEDKKDDGKASKKDMKKEDKKDVDAASKKSSKPAKDKAEK